MTIDVEQTAADLKREKLVDRGRLKPGGRKEIKDVMERTYREARLRAHVLLLPAGERLEDARPLWDKLGLDAQQDLLFVTNGRASEARGWGLAARDTDSALAKASPAFHEYLGRGVARALEELATLAVAKRAGVSTPASPESQAPAPAASSGAGRAVAVTAGAAGALAVGAVVGLAIYRRNKRKAEVTRAFEAAVAPAEAAYAELILAAEDLAGDEGAKIQLKAGELKKRFDELVSSARGSVAAMEDPVTLGKVRQLQNEFAALRSTGLQKTKEQAECSRHESSSTSPAQRRIVEWDPSSGSDLSSEPSSTSAAEKKS